MMVVATLDASVDPSTSLDALLTAIAPKRCADRRRNSAFHWKRQIVENRQVLKLVKSAETWKELRCATKRAGMCVPQSRLLPVSPLGMGLPPLCFC